MELLVIIIILSLIFDYINGFHDAANSIATIVSTKVLTPFQAVIWAAFFNFVAFFIAKYIIGGFGIANTVSKTVVEQYITLPIILSGVIAAIAWNLFTWWKGIPSSSSHTLIGGFAGAAIMAHGFEAIQLNIILKIAAFIFLAPFIGMIVAFGFTLLVLHMCKRVHPHMAEVWFKKLQLVSSALFSIGHGLNDSQKVMGIIAAALIAAHSEGLGMGINSISDLPDWVAFSCFTAISLGTMSGGWKIVKTMGTKITKVSECWGFIMGAGMAMLELIMRPTLLNLKDVENVFGLETMGIIPNDQEYFRDGRVILEKDGMTDSAVRQNFTSAAYILQNRLGLKDETCSFYVTSAEEGEGKSTVAANLAVQLSDMEKKVLLVDLNTRNPRLGSMFLHSVDYSRTLNALYKGETDPLEAVISLTGYLDLLPSVLERNAIPMDGQVFDFIRGLEKDYDYVMSIVTPFSFLILLI